LRKLPASLGILLVVLLALPARAEEFVAIVDLKFIKDTGDTAAVLCLGDDDERCEVYATLYLFDAKVRKVLSGDAPQGRFRVLFGHHALPAKDMRGVIAVLRKIEGKETSEDQYQIVRWGDRHDLYCFERYPSDDSEEGKDALDVKMDGSKRLKCYEKQ